jgi:hypothetical protein
VNLLKIHETQHDICAIRNVLTCPPIKIRIVPMSNLPWSHCRELYWSFIKYEPSIHSGNWILRELQSSGECDHFIDFSDARRLLAEDLDTVPYTKHTTAKMWSKIVTDQIYRAYPFRFMIRKWIYDYVK